MKIEEITEKIQVELQKGKLTAQELSFKTGIVLLTCYKALKLELVKGVIFIEEIDKINYYNLVDSSISKNNSIQIPIQKSGRDMTKYIFRIKTYSKSQCVLAVIKEFNETKRPTFNQIKEVFPDSIISRFGIVKPLNQAKKLSIGGPRYFMKDEQLLTSSDGIVFAVCNQWTLQRLLNFIDVAEKLGYKITIE